MNDVLLPNLTALDSWVLSVLDTERGLRAGRVAELVYGIPSWHCDSCDKTMPARYGRRDRGTWRMHPEQRCWRPNSDGYICDEWMHPVLTTTLEQRREVLGVLRGAECLRLVENRGGWWRRTTS